MNQYTITLGELIENNVNIFNFDYPLFNEEYKPTFEKHFIDYFYFDEIAFETVAKFKQRLNIKLNLIMSYYNKIFLADNLEQRILDNYDVTETYERNVNNKITSTNSNNLNSTNSNNLNSTTENTNKNLFSENAIDKKEDFNNIDYFSNITKDIGSGESTSIGSGESSSTSNGENNTNEENTESWTRKMSGNIGVQTDSDSIVKYWQSLRKIELEIFQECDDLFMGVY